jgi:hypothetical protein
MVGSLPGLRLAFSAPRPSLTGPGTTTMIVMTGVMNGVVVGGCIVVRMVTAAPAGNSTGAADRVSQPVEPTARVFLQHGRSSLGPSKPPPSENGDTLKDGGPMPTSPEASSSDGFLSPRTGSYPPAGPVLDLPSGRVADGGVMARTAPPAYPQRASSV